MEDTVKPNLMNCLENISGAASKSGLDFRKLDSVGADIETVATFLEIKPSQAILFSVLADLSLQKTVTLDGLAKHFECSVLKVMSDLSDIEALEKKGYIRKMYRKRSRRPVYNDIGFSVPASVIDALVRNNRSALKTDMKFDLPAFLKQVSDIIDDRNDGSMSTKQVCTEVEFLISNNSDLQYVSFIDRGMEGTISKCTAFTISYVRLKGQVNVDFETFANAFFDDLSEQLDFCQMMASGTHELVAKGFLKHVPSEFEGDKSVTLSYKTAKELFRSYPDLLKPETVSSAVTSYRTLKVKRLWFNINTQEHADMLEEILRPGKFRTYCRQLKSNGLTGGLTAIFFGPPGTGKTELAYQLARKTRRDIMMIDLSKTRSKWFGESEKKVKQIFDDYAAILKTTDTEPILFINEADGLLTRRIDLGVSNESSDRVTNTMQNVMLQALETFEGILIATTNLTGNLDKAFERRFTFRIDFPKPDKLTRSLIWKDKLPGLSEEEAAILGERFEMSGGEIDNQVRHVLLKKALRKKENLFDALMKSCKNDLGFTGGKKIGF